MAMATSVLLGALGFFSATDGTTATTSPSKDGSPEIVLTIAMTSECTGDAEALDIATREATRVWSSAGVRVRWVSPENLPYTSPRSDWLVARCVDGEPARATKRAPYVLPVAAIRFVGALPTNTIIVSLGSANSLLNREVAQVRDMTDRFRALRDLRLGRMLGRAIAHEIGHFLSQSGAHTRTGLMRASHTVTAFTSDSLVPFKVDRRELAIQVAEARPAAPLP